EVLRPDRYLSVLRHYYRAQTVDTYRCRRLTVFQTDQILMRILTATAILYRPQQPVVVITPWAVVRNSVLPDDQWRRILTCIEVQFCFARLRIYRGRALFQQNVFRTVTQVQLHIVVYDMAACLTYTLLQVQVGTAARCIRVSFTQIDLVVVRKCYTFAFIYTQYLCLCRLNELRWIVVNHADHLRILPDTRAFL